MTATSDLLIQCNNQGIRLFELGRLEEAKRQFQQAFKAVLVVQKEKPEPRTSEDLKNPEDLLRCWTHPIQRSENHIYVYSRAMELNQRFDTHRTDIYHICIAYNLGLTYHLLANASTKSRSWSYQQACALYELAMVSLERILLTDTSSAFLNDLRVVILNNAGHIYYADRVNFTAATQCFAAVCSVVSGGELAGNPTDLEDSEIDLMVSNVLLKYSISAPVA